MIFEYLDNDAREVVAETFDHIAKHLVQAADEIILEDLSEAEEQYLRGWEELQAVTHILQRSVLINNPLLREMVGIVKAYVEVNPN